MTRPDLGLKAALRGFFSAFYALPLFLLAISTNGSEVKMDDASRINNIRRSYPRYGVGRRDLAAPLVGHGGPKTTHVTPPARAWVEIGPLPRWLAAIVIFSLSVLGWAGIVSVGALVARL